MMAQRPVRSAGRAVLLCNSRDGGMRQGSHQSRWVRVVILVCLFLSALPQWAQHNEHDQTSVHEKEVIIDHEHHGAAGSRAGWDGSVAGIAYSEFNHHLTGMLVLIIGLSELRQTLAMPFWALTRFLLPGALLTVDTFLLIRSDRDAGRSVHSVSCKRSSAVTQKCFSIKVTHSCRWRLGLSSYSVDLDRSFMWPGLRRCLCLPLSGI
jgi:hypothetical protein